MDPTISRQWLRIRLEGLLVIEEKARQACAEEEVLFKHPEIVKALHEMNLQEEHHIALITRLVEMLRRPYEPPRS